MMESSETRLRLQIKPTDPWHFKCLQSSSQKLVKGFRNETHQCQAFVKFGSEGPAVQGDMGIAVFGVLGALNYRPQGNIQEGLVTGLMS